jgi:hypothetical protein
MKTTKSQKKLEITRDDVRKYYGMPSDNLDKGVDLITQDALGRNSEDNT